MPATGAGGEAWKIVYEWRLDADSDFELGNADVSEDGLTFYVALTDSRTNQPGYYQFDLTTSKLVNSFVVSEGELTDMITAEVVSC